MSITTDTKKHVKSKVKITFNGREVGYVMVEFIEWHVDDICDDCLEEDECTQCHRDLVDINTYDFVHRLIPNTKDFPDWKNVVEIYFTTDSTWLTYGGKDVMGNILMTRMVPIHSINNIHIDSTEPKFSESKINHLDTFEKKSLK